VTWLLGCLRARSRLRPDRALRGRDYNDPNAPKANSIVPSVTAIVAMSLPGRRTGLQRKAMKAAGNVIASRTY